MSFLDKSRKWLVMIGTGISSMIVSIDFTIVNTILPTIQADLSAAISELQWLVSSFGITFATLLKVLGRLGDILGRRLILYLCMFGFLLASLGAGLS